MAWATLVVALALGSYVYASAQFGVANNLTRNWSFETWPTSTSFDPTNRVATDWTRWERSGHPEFWRGTEFARRFGLPTVEKIDGLDSQYIKADDPFDAGIYQIFSGLRPGEWYSAIAFVLSIFQTTAVPDPSIYDGLIIKQIGIDPEGQANPWSDSIIWSDPIGQNMDSNTWGQRMTFQAQGTTATFFVRIQSLQGVSDPGFDNIAIIDAAQVRLAPISEIIVPEVADMTGIPVMWRGYVPNAYPSEVTVDTFEVEVSIDGGRWVTWIPQMALQEATWVPVVPGHTYRFRVRSWARYTAPVVLPGRPTLGGYAEIFGPWKESTPVAIGNVIQAVATDNRGRPQYGVPVHLQLGGTVVSSARTDGWGQAYLSGTSGTVYSVVPGNTSYLAPEPIHNQVIGPGVTPVRFSMRPPDDLFTDGSFEASVEGQVPTGWGASGPGATVTRFRTHGGYKALELSTVGTLSGVCVERSFNLPPTYQPVLSLWTHLQGGAGGTAKVLRAEVLSSSGTALARQDVRFDPNDLAWRQTSLLISGGDQLYSGTVTVRLCAREPDGVTTASADLLAYVDDLSLGRSNGGPLRTFLPKVGTAQ